jgi:formamidopyrimidine-DNA glycosylase
MADNTSVDLARVPGDNPVAASPDLLRAMVQTFAEALMGAASARARARIMPELPDVDGFRALLAEHATGHRARIHPRQPAGRLSAQERRELHGQMRRVLRASVRAGCVPPRPSWLTGARGQRHPQCPCCCTTLCRSRIGGRTTVWCPQCQDS